MFCSACLNTTTCISGQIQSAAEKYTILLPPTRVLLGSEGLVIDQADLGAVQLDFVAAYLEIRLSTMGTGHLHADHSTACPAGKAWSTHLEAGTFRLVYIPRLDVSAPVCDEAPVVVVVF